MIILRIFFILLPLTGAAFSASAYTPGEKTPTVVVMADPSLALPLAQFASHYTRDHHVTLSLSFRFTGDQAQHIENGEDAGVFITPIREDLQRLKVKGLTDVYSEQVVAVNHMVLVGPEHSVLSVDLSKGSGLRESLLAVHTEPKLVLPNPEYLSAGILAYRAIGTAGVLQEVVPMLEYADSLRDILKSVGQGQRYSVLYATDAAAMDGLKVIDTFSEPVHYYAAVIASEDMDAARNFLKALTSPAAQSILRAHGFTK